MEETKNEAKEHKNSAVQLLEKEDTKEKKVEEKIQKVEDSKTQQKDRQEEKQEQQKVEKERKQEQQETVELELPQNDNTKTGIVLLIIAIIVILLAISSTIFAAINIGNTKIVKGVTIGTIDVSKLTKEEATEKIGRASCRERV